MNYLQHHHQSLTFTDLTIDHFMSEHLFTVQGSTPIREIIDIFLSHQIRHLPVIENERPVGIISERDLNKLHQLEWAATLTAQDLMIPHPYQVKTKTKLGEVVPVMMREKIGSALIIDSTTEELVGIFTTTDALNALEKILSMIDSLEERSAKK